MGIASQETPEEERRRASWVRLLDGEEYCARRRRRCTVQDADADAPLPSTVRRSRRGRRRITRSVDVPRAPPPSTVRRARRDRRRITRGVDVPRAPPPSVVRRARRGHRRITRGVEVACAPPPSAVRRGRRDRCRIRRTAEVPHAPRTASMHSSAERGGRLSSPATALLHPDVPPGAGSPLLLLRPSRRATGDLVHSEAARHAMARHSCLTSPAAGAAGPRRRRRGKPLLRERQL